MKMARLSQHRAEQDVMGCYGSITKIEKMGFVHARWVTGPVDPDFFERREDSKCLVDRDGQYVILFKSDWALRWAQDNYKDLQFLTTAPEIRAPKKK